MVKSINHIILGREGGNTATWKQQQTIGILKNLNVKQKKLTIMFLLKQNTGIISRQYTNTSHHGSVLEWMKAHPVALPVVDLLVYCTVPLAYTFLHWAYLYNLSGKKIIYIYTY